MKKLIAIGILVIFAVSGCGVVDEAKKSYENVKDETGKVVEKAGEIKAKVQETALDLQNAVDTVNEAKKAIDEISE